MESPSKPSLFSQDHLINVSLVLWAAEELPELSGEVNH